MQRSRQQGDTIIEILLAITIFSLVAIGAITIMNQGTNSSQRALEITLVKQQIDSQADALRAIHQTEIAQKASNGVDTAEWQALTALPDSSSSPVTTTCGAIPNNIFALDGHRAILYSGVIKSSDDATAPPYSQAIYDPTNDTVTDVYGLWIEKQTNSNPNFKTYYDFTIRACWYGPGLNVPMQLQTIVRLYEP